MDNLFKIGELVVDSRRPSIVFKVLGDVTRLTCKITKEKYWAQKALKLYKINYDGKCTNISSEKCYEYLYLKNKFYWKPFNGALNFATYSSP